MKNASRMARYMMMRGGSGENRTGYDGGYGVRNNYDHEEYFREPMREGGNYARDNYGVDNRFRDRRGREHYDNGRFAPRNDMEPMGGDYYGPYGRRDNSGTDHGTENRRGGEVGMNMIGFDRPQEMTSHYPTRVDYAGGNEMETHSGMKMTGGAMVADMMFNDEIAKEWTHKMHNEDGTKGEHWNMEQVKKLMTQRGVEYNLAEVYAIMNSLYSDYCKVFKKYGFNSPEAYLDLALAWLNDSDAVPDKAMAYYEYVVKH